MRLVLAALLLAACDPMTPPTDAELASQARKLFESKRVFKDHASNLCLVVLQGDFGRRPIYETYLIRCKSEKHLLEPAAE